MTHNEGHCKAKCSIRKVVGSQLVVCLDRRARAGIFMESGILSSPLNVFPILCNSINPLFPSKDLTSTKHRSQFQIKIVE
jgi:hypothetical protein